MKLQNFIDILYLDDSKKIDDFYTTNGKNIFQDTKLLMALLDLEWNKKNNLILKRLAGIISGEFVTRQIEKKKHFDILPIYKHFQEYMYNDCSFIGVPFEEWKELQKEYIDLLKVFIQEGKLGKHQKDPRLQDIYDKNFKHREKLLKKYPHLENPYGFYG